MNARAELLAYGFTEQEGSGLFVKITSGRLIPTQAWQPYEDGWICLQLPTAPSGTPEGGADPSGGMAWGRPIVGSPYIQVPFGQTEPFKEIGGLHPAIHPECFVWVWPDADVEFMYKYAPKDGEGNPWRKVVHEDGTREMVLEA